MIAFVIFAIAFRSCNAGDKRCKTRRLESVGEIDSVCSSVTKIVQDETFKHIIALLFRHSGESQHDFLMRRKDEVVSLCKEKLSEFEAQQCSVYLDILPAFDGRDMILKAAWFDCFGDNHDKQNGCSAVVGRVSEAIAELGYLDGEDASSLACNPTKRVLDVLSDGIEEIVARGEGSRRRLAEVEAEEVEKV